MSLSPREFPETRGSLLGDLRRGGGDAMWREFFDLYAPPVLRVALMRGLDQHDAEDIVQQVMLAVLAHIKTFEYQKDRGRFRAWIRQIAENKIADLGRAAARDSKRRSSLKSDAANGADRSIINEMTAEKQWEEQWRLQDLRHCLELVEADISPRRMEAFRLYVLRGVSAEETARRLGMTRGHVYVVRGLVLSLLREKLRELDAEDETPPAARSAASTMRNQGRQST